MGSAGTAWPGPSLGAWEWTSSSGLTTLPPDLSYYATAISSNGLIAEGNNTNVAVYNSVSSVLTGLSSALPSGSSYLQPNGINSSGTVVGGFWTPSYNQDAFVSIGGTLVDMNGLPGTSGWALQVAYGINDNGAIVGTGALNSTGQMLGFLYSNGTVTTLGSNSPASVWTEANAINSSGEIVGFDDYDANYDQAAAIWTSSGAETLLSAQTAAAGLSTSDAYAVNSGGVVVGWGYTPAGNMDAFMYSGGVMTDLNTLISPTSGWVLNDASGINDEGQIVGTGTYDGHVEAFVLDPISTPEPISMIFFGTGLVAVSGYVARRRRR